MLLKNNVPSTQSLQAFESAARLSSFSAAARELHSSQSAISQLIRGLERQLKLSLFTRVYRGVRLTSAGNQLYLSVAQGLGEISSCIENLQRFNARERLNVATDFAFAAYWLLPKLAQFQRQHPQLDVRLLTSQDISTTDVSDVDISIVFAASAPAGSSLLFKESVFPVCSPSFYARHGPIHSHKTLAKLPLLALDYEQHHSWLDWSGFYNARRSNQLPSSPVLSFNNYTLLIQAAITGQGVGLGWARLVDDLLMTNVLVAMTEFELTTDAGYYACRNRQSQSPCSQAFVEWLQSCCEVNE